MKYRKFGKLDWSGSALGFGCMRLPTVGPKPDDVSGAESVKMIRYAIDNGVNYIDTAYLYHAGHSEKVVGKALQDGYRQKVKVATKMPPWIVHSQEDMDRIFQEQLERLQTDKIDFYLLHGQNKEHWPRLRDLGVLKWAEKYMADGKIGRLGFSFHDNFATFKEIVNAYDNWTFCQIQYNYMDTDYQAGTKGLEYAAEKGLAVVVMEPLRGGNLAKRPPDQVSKIWNEAAHKRTPAEWGLLWVWEHPEVSVLLSGMTTMEQVEENVSIAGRCGPGVLNNDELALIERVKHVFKALSPIPCTSCAYCMPCPNGVEIPRIFELYNNGITYDDLKTARFFYQGIPAVGLKPGQRGDQCLECGQCEEACPQKIPVSEWLKKVHTELGAK